MTHARRTHRRRAQPRDRRGARARTSRSGTATAPTVASCWPRSSTSTRSWSARATKVDAEALAAASRLKVVARAGVGLDNVDVRAATQAGVMVVNAPTSNIVSAAELAVALMLAAARHVSPGARRAQERRVEALALHRHRALREDRRHRRPRPDRRPGRAAALGVRHEGDRLRPVRAGRPRRPDGRPPGRPRHPARRGRLHVACTCRRPPRPSGLIGAEQLAQGQAVAGAGQRRPRRDRRRGRAVRRAQGGPGRRRRPRRLRRRSRAPTARSSSSRTSSPPRTSAPPPTRPRRRPASPSPARCGSRCRGELVPDAVNVQGGVIAEDVRPGIPLTEKLGRVFTGLAGEVAQQVDVEVRGEITDYDVKVLELAALKGIFADIVEDQVSYVNAPLLAAERGIAVRLVDRPREPRPPQPDHDPRHPRRRLAGLGQRHAGRHQPARAAGRGQRLRRRPRAHRAPRVPHVRRPPRAWSAPSAGSSARPASTSPACRSPATRRAARRWSRSRVDSAIPADVLERIRDAIDADQVRGVDLSE